MCIHINLTLLIIKDLKIYLMRNLCLNIGNYDFYTRFQIKLLLLHLFLHLIMTNNNDSKLRI